MQAYNVKTIPSAVRVKFSVPPGREPACTRLHDSHGRDECLFVFAVSTVISSRGVISADNPTRRILSRFVKRYRDGGDSTSHRALFPREKPGPRERIIVYLRTDEGLP